MKQHLHLKALGFLIILTVVGVTLFPSTPGRAQDPGALQSALSARPTEPVVVRLHVRDRDHLNAVAGRLDIWETHPEDLYVVARVTPGQYQWLEDLGYRLEIDEGKTAAVSALVALDPRFHYFDDSLTNSNGLYVVDFLHDINAAYPDLTELYDIGDAWLADQPGEQDRDIWVLRVTNEDPGYGPIEDKPVFFLFAGIHAREVAVPELAIRYIRYLTEGFNGEGGYGVDADVTWLVDHNAAHILLMQNPDGHRENEENRARYRRKNMDWDDGCSDPSSWGVDLNRNHSFFWGCCGGSSGSPCEETYRGPSAGSEPETQAFQAYFASVMRDQNGPNSDNEIPSAAPIDTTGIFISLHAYGDLVLWPWGFDNFGNAPNHLPLQVIGRKFAYYNGYNPDGSIYYDVDGGTDDWTYGKFGVASFTFEVGTSTGMCGNFFPPYGCIDGIDGMPRSFWAENKPAFLYAHRIARAPYDTAYGPDTEGATAVPAEVTQGMPVQLTATIADRRYGSPAPRSIIGAEFSVDRPVEDGTGNVMASADGFWGGTVEEATATLDTSGLAPGRHYILIHGEDIVGNWGPFSAVFIDVACADCDFNCDGVMNLSDHAIFAGCLAGPGRSSPPGACTPEQFDRADLDDDQDVDTADFAIVQAMMAE